jgi:predicted HicB family RNase H-like nuclease
MKNKNSVEELINKYMSLPYTMKIVPDKEEGGYTISFPELPGCATCVESLDDIKQMAEEVKREWLRTAIEDGWEIKSPQEFSGQLRLRMPKSLHQQLSNRASEEGVSLNQYIVYELGKAVGK